MEDDKDYDVTEDELYADAEIPESDWQLDEPLNLPVMNGATGYDMPGDMAEVYELDGDEDLTLMTFDVKSIVDDELAKLFAPDLVKVLTGLGFGYDWTEGVWR